MEKERQNIVLADVSQTTTACYTKGVSKKRAYGYAWYALRFEILSRDNFTCRYCGGQAPDVLLHVDHMIAVADGGSDDVTNLVSACEACNLGKEHLRIQQIQHLKSLSQSILGVTAREAKPTLKSRIITVLHDGPLPMNEIAALISTTRKVTSVILYRHKDTFLHLQDGTWGMRDKCRNR